MNGQFYIRIRGRVSGPFEFEKLRALRMRGQFSRFHEVSPDLQEWRSAATLEEIFAPPGRPAGPEKSGGRSRSKGQPKPGAVPKAAADAWHYAIAGEQFGPITLEEIRSLIQVGHIEADDFVWNETMPDWLPVSQIPELSAPRAADANAAATATPAPGASGKAVASLVLGILSNVVPIVGIALGLVAIPLAIGALRAIARSKGGLGGRGFALWGLSLSAGGVVGQVVLGLIMYKLSVDVLKLLPGLPGL